MPDAKTTCLKCGSEILLVTAERSGGVCASCLKFHALANISAAEAEKELELAATSLRDRARVLGISTRKIPIEEWQQIPADLSQQVPIWLKSLLSRHALYGIGLEHQILADKQTHIFSFQSPSDFLSFFDDGSPNCEVLKAGYVPIGYESNGNLWLVEKSAGPQGRTYLFDSGDFEGGLPSRRSGLTLSVDRLSRLMTGMGIFEIVLY